MKFKLPDLLKKIILHLDKSQIRVVVVGGAVRDFLRGEVAKDFDCEVFGCESIEKLIILLKPFGPVNEVGKSFSVVKCKLDDHVIDFALPRRDKKIGDGHKGFDVVHDSRLSFEEAAARRDFTINAIGYDLIDDCILDPFNGQKDLENKVLRHINNAFSEDPLRVYRAMQFTARFNLNIHLDTVSLCQNIDLSSLPKERVFDEFNKCLLKAEKPSLGFELADTLGILRYFPELSVLKGVPQDPKWHPEGDVWTHTMMVIDGMADVLDQQGERNPALMYAAICHDLGKPATTEFKEGHWRSYGHDVAGLEPSRSFLAKLTEDKVLIQCVLDLVKEHMKPIQLFDADKKEGVSDSAIRRLSLRVDIKNLILFTQADFYGTLINRVGLPECDIAKWLYDRVNSCDVYSEKPVPFLTGKDCLEHGLEPGPSIGSLIKKSFELQLDGDIKSRKESINWLKSQIR